MSDTAIRVENLSKAYRIGLKDERSETLMGAMTKIVRAPLQNFRAVKNLSTFDDARRKPDAVNHRFQTNGSGAVGKPAPISSTAPTDVVWALRDVSFEVKRGEVVGIIGQNGAGKSTLLKILARIAEPTDGQIDIHGRIGSLLEVGTGFHPDLTGRENIYLNGTILGMKKREIDARFDQIVDFSGVSKFIDTPVKRYSSGMRVRLAFSVAAHLEPEILLVDEVLAVGDMEFQRKCLGRMGEVAKEGRTVLFVSHNMEAILSLCPDCYLLVDGKIDFYGDSSQAVNLYLRSFSKASRGGPANVIYDTDELLASDQTAKIFRLEILDGEGCPKDIISTWDDLTIRIHYAAREDFQRGSFILDFFDYKQERLVVFDSGDRVPIKAGLRYVDCHIPKLPLSAGEYFVGGGLTISTTEWLCRDTNMATVQVQGRDVFALGRPPEYRRMLFAVEHHWQDDEKPVVAPP